MDDDRDHQPPSTVEKLLAEGKPRFDVFEERRRAGVPPPEIESALAIPDNTGVLSNIKHLPESFGPGGSWAWLATHIQRPGDLLPTRIPEWAGADEVATSCIFPRQVEESRSKTYKPIDSSEANCLRVTDVLGKGKGCVAARTLSPGELVARERALLLIPRTTPGLQPVAILWKEFMSTKERASFSALYNCSKSEEPDHDALGIVRTNSFLIPGMPGHNVLYVAVFETFARINHRCGGFFFF
jgi:hypothetical protein